MLFSIITITYNASRTLQRTLDSVACQTYRPIQHLIIDGASQDATVSIAEMYRQRAGEANASLGYDVVVVSEPDNGLYDAMNKGLRMATGDYVLFLNAGDALHDADTLSVVARCAQGDPLPAVVYGDTAITDQEGRFLHLRRHRPPRQLTWKSFRQGMLVCHQAFYARTDLAYATPYDLRYRHSADVDWCIRIMKEAERQGLSLVNTHAVLADFEEGGDSTQHHRDSLLERYRVMASHYGQVQTLLLHAWFVLRGIWRKVAAR